MKKTPKKLVEQAGDQKRKLSDLAYLNGDQLNAVYEKIADILYDFNVESDEGLQPDGTVVLDYDVVGHMENDGIGPYEYWGAKGYDRGTDHFQFDDYDFDYKKLTRRLNNEVGVELETVNGIEPEVFDIDGKRAKEKAPFTIYVTDESKVKALAAGVNESKGKTKYTKTQITEAIAYWKKQLKRIQESAVPTAYNVVREFRDEDGNVDNWLLTKADMSGMTPAGSDQPLVFKSIKDAVKAMWAVLENVYDGDFAHEAHDSDMDEKDGEYYFDMGEGEYELMKAIPVGTYDENVKYADI